MRFCSGQSFYQQLCGIAAEFDRFDFVKVGSAGRSAGGRELYTVHVGGPDSVLLLAGTHPLEYITTAVLCEWLFKLCRAMNDRRAFLDFDVAGAFLQRGVTAVLCHNPDGTEIAFGGGTLSQADENALRDICGGDPGIFNCNLNGVDLNHNFDAGWAQMQEMERAAGITSPSPRRYGGPAPASEPENRAVVALCEETPFRQALALHSQGEEIYWKYGENLPDYSEIMAHMLALSCGYRLVMNEGMASHAGFKDWFITRYNRPGFTVELGKGKNPLPLSMMPGIYRRVAKTLLMAALM